MNWLAHSYLGGPDPLDRIANLAGDFVRGIELAELDSRIRAGILSHRTIDVFTDRHPRHKVSKERIEGPLRRFSGPLVDVFYDHFLARDWAEHTIPGTAPLRDFVAEVYTALSRHRGLLPPRLQRAATLMELDDWLGSYATLDGVEAILDRMRSRIRRPIELHEGCEILEQRYDEFEADFRAFFPDLVAFVAADPSSPPYGNSPES